MRKYQSGAFRIYQEDEMKRMNAVEVVRREGTFTKETFFTASTRVHQ